MSGLVSFLLYAAFSVASGQTILPLKIVVPFAAGGGIESGVQLP
jgi:hypothetical protein